MGLQAQIRADMVSAMKSKEELRLSVLRGLLALFTHELTTTKRTPQDTLADDEVLTLIRRALKQRREAAAQFRTGGREDLATHEDEEAVFLEAYLPQMMAPEAVKNIVREKAKILGVLDKSGAGKLIGTIMKELQGVADGKDVKDAVDALFS
jgi:uncharacterized protein